MINEEKVKIMTKLAMYEQGKGRKYLPVSRYYRSDYIGLALIKNFFLVTIGYALIVAAVAVYFGEYLLENIHKMDLVTLGVYLIKSVCGGSCRYSIHDVYPVFGEVLSGQEKCEGILQPAY